MLCKWKTGDIITAQHLNQMTCAINSNGNSITEIERIVADKGTSTINSSGEIFMGAFTGSSIEPEHACANRGYVRTGWEYTAPGCAVKKGIFIDKSGVDNASSHSYPDTWCAIQLDEKISGSETKDIMLRVTTDCWGKVISQTIQAVPMSDEEFTTTYWQGPTPSDESPKCLQFQRRLGRIEPDYSRVVSSEDSNFLNKVVKTNDLVMPILPVRGEAECKTCLFDSVGLIGCIKDNSVVIKNIASEGGMKLTKDDRVIKILNGIEFYVAEVPEGEEGEEEAEPEFPNVLQHTEPQGFNVTVACIPIKEQHYKWCESNSTWKPVSSGCSTCETPKPECKGTIKIQASTFNGNNWQIGWKSSGDIEIPVYDFSPATVKNYQAGRGINICCKAVDQGEDNPSITEYIICNTMKIEAGCGIKVCEVGSTEGEEGGTASATYKIHSAFSKLESGPGICVSSIADGFKVASTGITLKAGDGISVSGSGLCWTVTNSCRHAPTEVTGGCGISVCKTGNVYKVSVKQSCGSSCQPCSTTYTFDANWFTVTNNHVTLKQTKINEVANQIATDASSRITPVATAILGTGSGNASWNCQPIQAVGTITNTNATTANMTVRIENS